MTKPSSSQRTCQSYFIAPWQLLLQTISTCFVSSLPFLINDSPYPKKKKGNFNSYILILFCWAYFCPDLHLSKLPGQNSVC